MGRRALASPTVATLAAFLAVFLAQRVLGLVAGAGVATATFALSTPVGRAPWTLVSSVYAHASLTHLVANSVALAVLGFPLERATTPVRFHLFFVATGALAGLAQVWTTLVVGLAGPGGMTASVLGASGAIFALLGYLLTSNPLTDRVVGTVPVSGRVQLLAFALVASAITVATASRQVALVAHVTGLLLGLVAGRHHLLRPRG